LRYLPFWSYSTSARGQLGPREEIPFVPTPVEVIDKMLELAEVKKGDIVYDLGSGDGRIVIRAAQKYGLRAVGIEMDSLLLAKARKDAKAAGVSHLVEFRAEDALKADISKATVVTLYMLPWFNEAMKPRFKKYLKPGARIVAHDFGIEGWEPDRTEKLPEPERKLSDFIHYHTLYLWRMKGEIAFSALYPLLTPRLKSVSALEISHDETVITRN
jgi:SAM-dependent methyltransferase